MDGRFIGGQYYRIYGSLFLCENGARENSIFITKNVQFIVATKTNNLSLILNIKL